jgi:hypothetical protein
MLHDAGHDADLAGAATDAQQGHGEVDPRATQVLEGMMKKKGAVTAPTL